MISYCLKKANAMQRIQLNVSRGVTHHFVCTVPEKSIENVLAKMTERYNLDLSKDQKYRRKQNGETVADCVVYRGKDKDYELYIHLTAGDDLALFQKKGYDVLKDIQTSRSVFDGKYELVNTTRKKSAIHHNQGRSNSNSETITWRMTQEYYSSLKAHLERAVIVYPKDTFEFKKSVFVLERLPGFRGIRQQIGFLWAHTKKCWKHASHAEMPTNTLKLSYVRALGCDCDSLEDMQLKIAEYSVVASIAAL
jgi:hypothetical protein